MTPDLEPLFSGETVKQHLTTVSENLSRAAGYVYVSESEDTDRYVAYLETAVRIEDKETREAFVSLVKDWKCSRDTLATGKKAIAMIRDQLDAVRKQLEKPSP